MYELCIIIKKGKQEYYVKSPSGEICNNAFFEVKKEAEKYRDILNAFYGGDKWTQSTATAKNVAK